MGVFSLVAGIVLLCLTPEVFSLFTLLALAAWGVAGYFLYQSRTVLHNLALSKRHKQTQFDEIAREQHLAKPEHAEKQSTPNELQPPASEVKPAGEEKQPTQAQ